MSLRPAINFFEFFKNTYFEEHLQTVAFFQKKENRFLSIFFLSMCFKSRKNANTMLNENNALIFMRKFTCLCSFFPNTV